MPPKLSIVTVVKNRKVDLSTTMESIVSQTFVDFEWVVIDAESTDGTRELIEANAHRIAHWVSEPDGGLYDAMNKGLRAATGDWVQFLNAGDTYLSPTVLADLFALTEIEHAHFVYGDSQLQTEDGRTIRILPAERLTRRSVSKGMIACHQAMFVRRSVCPLYNLDWVYKAEFNWLIDIMLSVAPDRVMVFPAPVVNYQLSAYSASLFDHQFRQYLQVVYHRFGIWTFLWRVPMFLRVFLGRKARGFFGVPTFRFWAPYFRKALAPSRNELPK